MKTLLFGVLCAALSAVVPAGAQSPTVLLNNPEEAVFHFVVDPPELRGFDPSASVFASVALDYFSETPAAATEFQSLPPGATLRLEGLSEGVYLVVGFFRLPNRAEFPVRILAVRAGGGVAERFYSVYREPRLFTAKAGRGRLSAFPPQGTPEAEVPAARAAAARPPRPGTLAVRIDNQYEDWEDIPVFKSYGDYTPDSFSLEQDGAGFEARRLRESRYWPDNGTALSDLKIVLDGESLLLFVSTRSAMAAGLSLYLYFHDPQDPPEGNRVTVELLPAIGGKPGLAALWLPGRAPAVVGELASGSFFLEASLDMAAIGAALVSRPELTSLELAACFHDNRAYEEFHYLGTGIRDLPTPASFSRPTN